MRVQSAILALATMWGAIMTSSTTLAGGSIHRAFLENGLEVLLARKEGVPLVTIEIVIRAGSFIEPPELDGLTHLHEHMFFKANRAIPDQEAYLKRLDELGMSWNGSTSNEVVRYFFTLPTELVEEGLVFMRDAIQSPLFLDEELTRERKVVLGEYDRWEANPATHLRKAVNQGLFGKYYSRKNPIGDRAIIQSATREQLQFIQDEFYVPNNAALIISGEYDPTTVLGLAEKIFGGWKRRPDPFTKHRIPSHPPLLANDYRIVDQPVKTASILIGWHGPSVTTEPRMTVIADVLSRVLDQPNSRFQKALVDSGVCAAASLGYYTQKYVGPVFLALETGPDRVVEALERARAEIAALVEGGIITEQELESAKRSIVNDEVFEREKARDFALALAFWWSVGGTDYYLEYPQTVQEVTLEEINDFARTYLTGHHVVGVMVSKDGREKYELDESVLRRAFEGSAEAGREAGTARLTLSSGATAIVRTLSAGDVATLQIHFPGVASRVDERLAGVEQLLLRTLVDVARKKHLDELNRLGIKLYSRAHADYSMIGFDCLRSSFDRALEILAHTALELDFADADLERNRERMLVEFARAMDHPEQRVSYVVNRTFYPEGHAYRAYPGGTDESLRAITAVDVSAHRRELLQGGNMLVVAVGALSRDKVKAALEERLGVVPTGGGSVGSLDDLAGPADERLNIERKEIPSNYVLGKFRAPGPDHPDHDALRLALRIFSRKLWLEVRSKRALTYAVGSSLIVRLKSMGYISVSTTKPNEALRVIYDTLADLVANALPEDEVAAAALTFSTSVYLSSEAPAEQAIRLAWSEVSTGDFRRAFELTDRLRRVTPSDVQRVLGEYVRDIHYGVVGPAENLDRELFLER